VERLAATTERPSATEGRAITSSTQYELFHAKPYKIRLTNKIRPFSNTFKNGLNAIFSMALMKTAGLAHANLSADATNAA
jgi:hypothetical protein